MTLDVVTCSNHVEGRDRRMVAELLHEDGCAVRELCLPSLPQDWVEGLAPGLVHMLQPRHKPAVESMLTCFPCRLHADLVNGYSVESFLEF